MNGHRELVTMRRAGYKPACVYVCDYPTFTDWAKWGDTPTVCVAGETPELLDFRFLVGTTVHLDGSDPARVERITAACAAHAARVISTVFDPNSLEAIQISDTEGVMVWPQ